MDPTNNGIHSPMPSRNLLWTIELTIGNETVLIRRKVDIGMAVETPDIVAAHFGCAGDKFGDGSLPRMNFPDDDEPWSNDF